MPEHCNTEKKDINPEAVDIGDYNRDGSSFATVTPPIICVSPVNWTANPITYNFSLDAIEGTAFIRGKNLTALECAFLAESQPLKTLIFPEDGDIYIEPQPDNAWRAFIAIDNKFEYINDTENESNFWWIDVDKDYAEKCGHILLEHAKPYGVTWNSVSNEYSQPGQLKDPELGFPKFKTVSFVEYTYGSEGTSEPDTLNVTNYDLVYDSRGHIVGFERESSSSYTINTGDGGDLNVTSVDCSGTQISEGEDIIHLEFAGGLDVTFPVDENKAIINLNITNADPWLNVDCDGSGLTIAHEDAGPAGEQTTTKTLVLYQEETVETPAAFYDATLTYDAKGHVINVETGTPLDLTGGTTGVEVNRSLCTTGVSDTYTATTISFGSEFSVVEDRDIENNPTGVVFVELPITVNTDPHEWIEIEECVSNEPGYILNHGNPDEDGAQANRDVFAVTGADFNAATSILSFTNTDYKFDAKGHRLTTDIGASGFNIDLSSLVDTFDICAELNCPPNNDITHVLTIKNSAFTWVQVGPFECDDGTDEPSLIVYTPADRWISIDANAKTIGHADADSANVASNPDFISDLTSFSLTGDTLALNFTRHDITFDGKGHYIDKTSSTTTSISISLSSFNNEVTTYTGQGPWINVDGTLIIHEGPSTVSGGHKPAVTSFSGNFETASNTVAITLTYNEFGFDEKGHFVDLGSVATATASAVITFPSAPPPNDYTATDHWITLTNLDFTHNDPKTTNTTSKAILSSLDTPIAVNTGTNVVTFTFQSNTVERDEKGHILAFSADTPVDRTINFTDLLNNAMQTVEGGEHITVSPVGQTYTVNHDNAGVENTAEVSIASLSASALGQTITLTLVPKIYSFDAKGHYRLVANGTAISTSATITIPPAEDQTVYTGDDTWINVVGDQIQHIGPDETTLQPFIENITGINVNTATLSAVTIELTYQKYKFDTKGHYVLTTAESITSDAINLESEQLNVVGGNYLTATKEGNTVTIDHDNPNEINPTVAISTISSTGNSIGLTVNGEIQVTLVPMNIYFDGWGHRVSATSGTQITLTSEDLNIPDPIEYDGDNTWITISGTTISHNTAHATSLSRTYVSGGGDINVNTGNVSLTTETVTIDAAGHITQYGTGDAITINLLPSTDGLTNAHALVWNGGAYNWEPIEEFACDETAPTYSGDSPWITISEDTITHGTSSTADPGKNITVLEDVEVDNTNASITVITKELQVDAKNHIIGATSSSSESFSVLPPLPGTPTEGQKYVLTADIGVGGSITYTWELVGTFECPSSGS